MTIKHLVISGGGPLGFRYLGALEKLEIEGFWKHSDIESIYCTSIGSILGTFICLKYDWDTLNKYIIERPWNEAFKVHAKQIFDSYYNKGLFDKKITETIFKPLLQAKDLSLNITLKELYEYSKIDLHIFTFEANNFKTIEFSHINNPEMELLQALTMSSALPGLFMPIIIEDKCYIDGGVMCNYPLNECLRDHPCEDEVLGIRSSYGRDIDGFKNITITKESSLLEYAMSLTINAMNFIRDSNKVENIKNTIRCYVDDNPLTLDNIQEMINKQELRRQWLKQGEEDASQLLMRDSSLNKTIQNA